jgi:hypothetical protein
MTCGQVSDQSDLPARLLKVSFTPKDAAAVSELPNPRHCAVRKHSVSEKSSNSAETTALLREHSHAPTDLAIVSPLASCEPRR